MKSRYSAFVTSTIDPVVLNSAAISGVAESTVVDEMGARNAQ